MAKLDRLGWADGICFTSYGLRIGVRVNTAEALEPVLPLLPPGWKPGLSPVVDYLYSVRTGGSDRASVRRFHLLYTGPLLLARSQEREVMLETFESNLHLLVAEAARRRVFVHAGVVGWKGRALLIPGRSFSGKSTLVAALVRAGATYYSDEYAVLDAKGHVHPFPRPLSLRGVDGGQTRFSPVTWGGRSGTRPLPVALVAVTRYRPGSCWRPRRLPEGRAVLALLDNTVPALRKPAAVMDALQQVACRAATLKGSRGEADATARALLRQLES